MAPGDKSYLLAELAEYRNTLAGSLNSRLRAFRNDLPKTLNKQARHNLRCLEAALEALTTPFGDVRESAETTAHLSLEEALGFHK